MDENFITLDNLETTHVNGSFLSENNIQENGEKVYQVQAFKNEKASIIHVGFMKKLNDILIETIELPTKYKCHIVSKVYNQTDLKQLEKTGTFEMIKILIFSNNSVKLTHIANLCLNFHTLDHIKKNISIIDILSEKEKIEMLSGSYSISLHFKENNKFKFVKLETLDNFPGIENVFILLTEWLLCEEINDILNKLT
jgi:hypothetical protein